MAGEATEQAWKKQVNSVGVLGTFGGGTCCGGICWVFNHHLSEEIIIHPGERQSH